MSLRSALMVVSLLGLVSLAAAIIVPDPPVVSSNAACPNNVCVVSDRSAVYQFTCTSPNTTTTIVYWNIGGYQVVDITEFMALEVTFTDTLAPASASTLAVVYSELIIKIDGTADLFNTFNASTFTISCISIIDNVNINSAPVIWFINQAAPPSLPDDVSAPTWDVTDCTAGGMLMVKLSYQVEGPANYFNYTASLSGSGNTCTVMEIGPELTVLCEVQNAADLTATLTVCADSDCNFSAPITGLTCCTGELDVCTDDVSCTCLPGATQRGWGCEQDGDYSIDTYNGPQKAGQNSTLVQTHNPYPCPDVTPTPTPPPTSSPSPEDPDPLALILVVILCPLAGVAAGLVLALVLSCCFFKKS